MIFVLKCSNSFIVMDNINAIFSNLKYTLNIKVELKNNIVKLNCNFHE